MLGDGCYIAERIAVRSNLALGGHDTADVANSGVAGRGAFFGHRGQYVLRLRQGQSLAQARQSRRCAPWLQGDLGGLYTRLVIMAQIYEILVRMDRLKPDPDGVIYRTFCPDKTCVIKVWCTVIN